MPIPKKVIKFLDELRVKYNIIEHKTVYTAYDLANTLKEDLSKIAKTLVIKADGDFVLIVLPASHKLNLEKLKKALGVKKIEIAKEKVMKDYFKVKLGAITPFGKLHKNIPVYIDKALIKAKKVIAASGSFEQSLHLQFKDLLRATEAEVDSFAKKATYKVQKAKKTKKKRKPFKKTPARNTTHSVAGGANKKATKKKVVKKNKK